MRKSHRPVFRAALALALGAAALPAFAVGAKCPNDSPTLDVTSTYQNLVLRCTARARAVPACPPTHPQKVVMPNSSITAPPFGTNRDFCRPLNLVITAPSQAAQVMCPPGMNLDVNANPGPAQNPPPASAADACLATSTTQVPPILIPN